MKTLVLFVLGILCVISVSDAFADHSEVTITPTLGSSAPGCEETAEGCYIPKEATVDVGGKVIFSNTDTAAHTFTAGSQAEGSSGEFDTSLVIAGSSYEWTPTTVGEFPYYCMVHPWMAGLIVVQEAGHEEGTDEHTSEEVHTEEGATGMLSDGTQVSITASGEKMEIAVEFENSEHVNYDIMARQNGVILNDVDVHSHDGEGVHETESLSSDPVEVTITFQGYGVDDPKTGPIGEQVVFSNIVPEFGSSDTVNDIPPTTGDLPYEITITPTLGSGAPGCETTSQGCYSPKVASIGLGGKVIFSNTDTAAHTFTAGTPTDGPSGEFDSSLVMGAGPEPTQLRAGGIYVWTPTNEGQVPYYCMVHPWMTGIILVGEGTYIPPTEDDFDLQIIMGNQVYDLLDTATMNLFIDGVTNPQNVALEISDPSGTSIISRSFMMDSQGVPFEFRIDENFKTGTYKVVATTNNDGNTITDTAYFKVKSQYNSFKITSVQVTDQQGNPSNLEIGEMGFIKVNLEANKAITTLVTVNLFDSDLTSIGIGSIKTTLSSGNSEIILSFMIPSDVAVGPADIYVNAFSDWPSNGGIPLTGEISVTENIE